jgi:nucleoside-diphosphate-sugar epimerase
MVDVMITGGAGFLGARLARELLADGSLGVAGGVARPLSRVTLVDRVAVPPDLAADPRVRVVGGELGAWLDPAAPPRELARAGVIFHLAAAVSGECEADFDLGLRANLRATEALLACCRALGTSPVVVFASSLAVFGAPASTRSPRSSTTTRCRTRRPATASRSSSASSCWPTTPGRGFWTDGRCG